MKEKERRRNKDVRNRGGRGLWFLRKKNRKLEKGERASRGEFEKTRNSLRGVPKKKEEERNRVSVVSATKKKNLQYPLKKKKADANSTLFGPQKEEKGKTERGCTVMEDMYEQHDKNTCSSSTSPPSSSSSPQDEISLFLHQIMLCSTSSSSSLMTHIGKNARNSMAGGLGGSNSAHENAHPLYGSSLFQDEISAVESAAVVVSTSAGGFMSSSANMKRSSAANVSSSSVGVSENETDEYDCESEVYLLSSYKVYSFSLIVLRVSFSFCKFITFFTPFF